MSKCRVCRQPAVIDLPRHNANFCGEHLEQLCRRQVERAIADHQMLSPEDRILVAVSGGKDSLAVWDLLLELGHRADGLYVGLGIDSYSDESLVVARSFAECRGLDLTVVDLRRDYGYDVPTAAHTTRRAPCSVCGMSKRHVFDKAAIDGGYDVLVTGHNLDDEAAVLFGNTLRWEIEYLARQLPVLPARPGFPKKVKPLIRLSERETAAWCLVRRIDYYVDECPLAHGNRHLGYKDALNRVEERSPGAKAAFYHGFLERMAPILATGASTENGDLGLCARCGSPTTATTCSFCRVLERMDGVEPVPVERVMTRAARAAWRRRQTESAT